jgi:hypothetical protein
MTRDAHAPRRATWLPRRWIAVAALLASTTLVAAQSRAPRGYERRGEFTFTRIQYGGGMGGFGRGGESWSHDYPRADEHLSILLSEITTVVAGLDGTNVFRLDDEKLFSYPIAYVSEPGFWSMSDAEARAAREYVLKGGFLIFDDFEAEQLDNTLAQLRRILPERKPIRIDRDHPIFHTFFDVDNIYFPHPLVNVTPVYYGIFEEDDPSKRMIAIINHNNDLAEFWEWSATGLFPVDDSNEAYKLGVNYIIYGLTH